MAIYPGGTWRPVNWANARDDSTPATIVILHLTASEADSQWSYFNSSRKAASHFHVARSGHVEQYINTDHISAADAAGSNDAISIETEGADADGQWGAAQVEAIISLLAWINKTHGIPLVLKTTSSPTERGIGWHRLGISGNFPSQPAILRGRNQRGYAGESWSSSFGKVCPGNNRILQIPGIVEAAKNRVGGGPVISPAQPVDNWKGSMGWRKLRPGDTGADVKALQQKLIALGYSVGPDGADGKFGGNTTAAVKAFQKAHKLAQDAVVGAATQDALRGAKPAPSPVTPPKPKPVPEPTRQPKTLPKVKQGANNNYVGMIQRRLDMAGVDNVFGPKTHKAVVAWQKSHGLVGDGVVGPKTWAELLSDEDGKLKRGDRGGSVEIWQTIIGVKADGVFGPDTESATKAVQRFLRIASDGVVGAGTRGAVYNFWV